jgi:hypothetical protein
MMLSHFALLALMRFWVVLVIILQVLPLHGQSSAQAANDPIVLQSQSGKTKVLKPGARLILYGPIGTVPIRGRLLSGGDTISVATKNKGQVAKVPKSTITSISRIRIGFKVLAWYYAYQCAVVVVGGLAIILSAGVGGAPVLLAILILLPSLITSSTLLVLFAWLGKMNYPFRKWQIKLPNP